MIPSPLDLSKAKLARERAIRARTLDPKQPCAGDENGMAPCAESGMSIANWCLVCYPRTVLP